MPDSPDPLGKRALFWAPGEREDDGPQRPGVDEDHPGKHALFSSPVPPGASGRRPRAVETEAFDPDGYPDGRPESRHPSGASMAPDASAPRRASGAPGTAPTRGGPRPRDGAPFVRPGVRPRPPRPLPGMFARIGLECSSCGARSDVDMVEFVMLHLPVWFWRPGRGFTRFMTCPSCRRRTWVSASWNPWTR